MPLQDYQKEYLVVDAGLDPALYTTDDEGTKFVKRPTNVSPSVSAEVEQPTAIQPTPPSITPFKSAATGFAASAAPAVGAGVGAGLGGIVGSAVFPGPGTVVGAIIGGGIGALGTGMLQEEVIPEEWSQAIAEAQLANPYSFMGGGIATLPLAGFSPTTPARLMSGLRAVPKLATGMSPTPIEAQNLANLAIGTSIGPSLATGASLAQGQGIPPVSELFKEALISGVFSKPNVIGKNIYGFKDIPAPDINQQLQGELVPRVAAPEVATEPVLPVPPTTAEVTPLSLINRVTPTMGTWTTGAKGKEKYVPYKSAEESAATIAKGEPVIPRETAFEASNLKEGERLSQYQQEQLVRQKSYADELNAKIEQDRITKLEAQAELARQEAAAAQSELAAKALELKQGLGPKFTESRPAPLAVTETGRELPKDYTGVGEQARAEVAAESPADLAARAEEARLAGEAAPKYSEGSELTGEKRPIRTGFQERVLPEASKYEPTVGWFQKLNQHIFNKTGIKTEVTKGLVNDKGEPIAGVTEAAKKRIALNIDKMGADTPVHELYHAFLGLLRGSKRAGDKRVLGKYDQAVLKDPDYIRWKAERDASKLSSTPEEFQASNAGYEFISRHLNLAKEGKGQQWFNDFKAHLKTRFGKHATTEDYQRILNYKMMYDKPFTKVPSIPGSIPRYSEDSNIERQVIPSEEKGKETKGLQVMQSEPVTEALPSDPITKMEIEKQGKLGHRDGMEYGLTLDNTHLPILQQKYEGAMKEFKDSFASGASSAEQLAAFGKANFYGGALMSASKGEHPISGSNYKDFIAGKQGKKFSESSELTPISEKEYRKVYDSWEAHAAFIGKAIYPDKSFDGQISGGKNIIEALAKDDPLSDKIINTLINRNAITFADSEGFRTKVKALASTLREYNFGKRYSESSELTPVSHVSNREVLQKLYEDLAEDFISDTEAQKIGYRIRDEVDYTGNEQLKKLVDNIDFTKPNQVKTLINSWKQAAPKLWGEEPIAAKAIEAKPAKIPAPVKVAAEPKVAAEKPVKEIVREAPEAKPVEQKPPIVSAEQTWKNPEPMSPAEKATFIDQISKEFSAIDKIRAKDQAQKFIDQIREGFQRNIKYRISGISPSEQFRAEARANILLAQYRQLKNRWKITDQYLEDLSRGTFTWNWPEIRGASEAIRSLDINALPLAGKFPPKLGLSSVETKPLHETLGYESEEAYKSSMDKVRAQRALENAPSATKEAEVKEFQRKHPKMDPGLTQGMYSESSELPYKRSSFVPLLTGRIDKIAEQIKTPEARKTVNALHKFSGEADLLEGRIGNKMIDTVRVLKPQQVEKIYKHLFEVDNYGKSIVRLTPEEKAVSDALIEDIRYPRRLQKEMGMEVKAGKNFYREAGIKPDGYMFNMLDPDVAYTWAEQINSPKAAAYDKAYVDHLVKKGATPQEAAETLHEYKVALGSIRGGDADFAALNRAEGKGLPWELVDKNFASAATRYAKRAAKALSFFKHLQSDPEMRYLLNLRDQYGKWEPKDLHKELGEPLRGNAAVENAMRSVYGIDRPVNPTVMAAARGAANVVMGPGTAARNILNMPAFIAQYVQVSQLPEVFKAIASYTEAGARAFKNNAVKADFNQFDVAGAYAGNPDPVINLLNKFSSLARKYQGRDFSDKFEGQFYYALGEHLATANIAAAKNGNRESLRFIKRFADIVDGGPEGLLKRAVTQDDIERIAKRFTDAARGTYGEEGLPSFAIEGEIAPFTALSRFAIEKSNTIWKDVIEPMRQGIYGPFFRYLFASLGVGVGIEKFNELISGKRGQDPTINEVIQSGDEVDLVHKAIGLMQLSSYAGIVSDTAKIVSNLSQGKSIRYNQPLSFPLYTLITDTVAGNISDAVQAVQEGEDPFEVGAALATTIAKQSSQAVRYLEGQTIGKEETERKEKFRDVRVFEELEGETPAPSSTRSQELVNLSSKKFKRTADIGEAVKMLPDLLKKAIEDSEGNPEKLKRELRSLKQNNYQTMPNPDNMPQSFIRYLTFLQKTQGAKAASDRLVDYLRQNEINKAKSELVPSVD